MYPEESHQQALGEIDVNDPRDDTVVTIDYTNWRGERSVRRVRPIRWHFGSNEWHPENQWLMYAYCFESNAVRVFAVAGIHWWRSANQ